MKRRGAGAAAAAAPSLQRPSEFPRVQPPCAIPIEMVELGQFCGY